MPGSGSRALGPGLEVSLTEVGACLCGWEELLLILGFNSSQTAELWSNANDSSILTP